MNTTLSDSKSSLPSQTPDMGAAILSVDPDGRDPAQECPGIRRHAHADQDTSAPLNVVVTRQRPIWWDDKPMAHSRSFYQSSLWGRYVDTRADWTAWYLYAQRGETVTGILLAYTTGWFIGPQQAFHRRTFSVPMVRWHHGPVLADPSDQATTSALLTAASKIRRAGAIVRGNAPYGTQPEVGDHYRSLAQSIGLRCDTWASYIMDVTGASDTIWSSIRDKERSAIRKLRRNGVDVRWLTRDDMPTYLALMQRTLESSGRSHIHFAPTEALWDIVGPDVLKMPAAWYKDEIRAVWPLICYGDSCHFFAVVRDPSLTGPERSLNDLVQWEIIDHLAKSDIQSYDLSGVSPSPQTTKENGIRHFKKKWGGRYIEYPMIDGGVGLLGRLMDKAIQANTNRHAQ